MESLTNLQALTGAASTSDQYMHINPNDIDPDPKQDRQNWDDPEVIKHLEEMTASVKAQGVRRAIEVKEHPDDSDRWMIIAGEVRWRSAMAAGLTSVPCLWRKNNTEDQSSLDMLTENLSRKGLNVMDVARALQRRLDDGMERDVLVKATGKSKPWVSKRLSLLKLHDDVLALAENNLVTDPDSLLSINKCGAGDREKAIAAIGKGQSISDVLKKIKPKKESTVSKPEQELIENDDSGSSHTSSVLLVTKELAVGLMEKYQPGLFSEGDDIAEAWAIFIAEDS